MRRRSPFTTGRWGFCPIGFTARSQCIRAYGGVVPELASRDHVRRLLPLVREALAEGRSGPGIHRRRRLHGRTRADRRPAGGGRLCRRFGLKPGASRRCAIHHLEGHLLAPLLEPDPPAFPFLGTAGIGGPHPTRGRGGHWARTAFWAKPWTMPAARPSTRPRSCSGLPYPGGAALADTGGSRPQRALHVSASHAGPAGSSISVSVA